MIMIKLNDKTLCVNPYCEMFEKSYILIPNNCNFSINLNVMYNAENTILCFRILQF